MGGPYVTSGIDCFNLLIYLNISLVVSRCFLVIHPPYLKTILHLIILATSNIITNMTDKTKNSSIEVMKRNAGKAEAMLKLLANGKRLMILCNIVKEAKSVGELAELVDLSQSALSQHLAKMRMQGLVEADKRGKAVYYRVSNPEVEAILSTLYLIYCK